MTALLADPHFIYIAAAYGVWLLCVLGLGISVYRTYRRHRRQP